MVERTSERLFVGWMGGAIDSEMNNEDLLKKQIPYRYRTVLHIPVYS